MTANYAVAPGAYLEEWLEEQGLSQQAVAEMLGSSRKQVNEIINGHAPISSETAMRLERVVGIPAATWLKYEAIYRSDRARLADSESLAEHLDEIHPDAVAFLRKIGATKATKAKPGFLVGDFLAFHRCGTWDAYVNQSDATRKGDYALAALKEAGTEPDRTLLTCWLRAGELTEEFEQGRGYTFDPKALRSVVPELRNRVASPDADMLNDVHELLASVGVVFLVLPPPRNLPLRGITRWIDKKVPVIQQTGRWVRDGFVIWALFHELGHVLNDPRGEMHLEFTTEKKRTSAAERGANAFALETLLSGREVTDFSGLSRSGDIVAKSKEIGIAPGLAVYLMHRKRLLDYKYGNKLFVSLEGTFQLR
ncbi:MAG: addiction module antidote protein HigA family [Marmoricola sp.]|nr:addiction module antidote protein HigA family [Marmoricola sp.]